VPRRTAVALALALAASLLGLAACGSSSSRRATTTDATPRVTGVITVYAAQSLTKAFTEIGTAFETRNPGAKVTFNFGGSAVLVGQLVQGAPADVFASADRSNMDKVDRAGLLGGAPSVIAHNALEIVVGKGNPKRITGLRDLAAPGIVVSLCAVDQPCGRYARQALADAQVSLNPRSQEASVSGVVGRVQNGEADAGIVYVTDVSAAPNVDGVPIPAAQNVPATYTAAVLKDAPNARGASAFVAFVSSPAGQAILRSYGFLPR
jgi:molybdate transport system substrate-binding protein